MKIVMLSDTHNQLNKVNIPYGDVLFYCGDLTNRGTINEIASEAVILKSFDFKHKIFVAGNHDWSFDNANHHLAKNIIEEAGFTYLQDSTCEVDGIKIYGSPYSPAFYDWAFNLNRGEAIAAKWAQIPDDTQILITHGPPYGILDLVSNTIGRDPHQGCQDLLSRVNQLKELKLHTFGHLHFNHGLIEKNGIKFVNAAMCDDQHKITRIPVVVEI